MRTTSTFVRPVSAIALAVLALAHPASAQTGVGLVLSPGPKDQRLEINGSVLFMNQAETEQGNFDTRLTILESEGRYRFLPAQPMGPAVGYSVTWMDVSSDHPALPQKLADLSIGVGSAFTRHGEWWFAGTLGAGFAGDKPLADSDAWYFKASLIAGRQLGKGILVGVIDYDGNRAIFPDIPLPGIAYTSQFSDELRYVVGMPFSALYWKPMEKLTIDITYTVPWTIEVYARYAVSSQFEVLARLDNVTRGFHIKGTDDDRRLFFSQRRVEVGGRWTPTDRLGVLAAIGYAFNQEFEFGFDVRNAGDVADLSSEPYLRFAVEWRP